MIYNRYIIVIILIIISIIYYTIKNMPLHTKPRSVVTISPKVEYINIL